MTSSAAGFARRSLLNSNFPSSYRGLQRLSRTNLTNNAIRKYTKTTTSKAAAVNLTRPTTRTTATPTYTNQSATSTTSSTAPPSSPSTSTTAAKTAAPVRVASTPPKPTSQTNTTSQPTIRSLRNGLSDELPPTITSASPAPETPTPLAPSQDSNGEPVDWSRSFHGLSTTPFSKEAAEVLMAPIDQDDVEIKPDGILYLPEIKYRRILNRAFGPGGWGMAPRGETIVTPKSVTREYGLVVHGRLVSLARGEQQYFDAEGIPTATEGCKSNALMRCCKDLGIASELWDPVFIRKFMAEKSREVWVEHVKTKSKKKIVMRKDVAGVNYPWKETKAGL
ncbi:hypothetical protein FKW77_004173 [Venturia effusa]|uniref:Mitochondrial genome maintenance protein MGM101 n=1 Tax=Venturia effusa TaxID=50376 RepID=A0A517LIJ2_9PEZI|nr:hypothetical protein FKW77_004173 [Venturia effusa]